MTKLNQIIAIEKGDKTRAERTETDLYHSLEKSVLFTGISRTYTPKDEEGDQLPPESTKVQIKSKAVIKQLAEVLTRRIDIIATKDEANTHAKANIVVDDTVIAPEVPVTTLMSLEKELEKLAAFVGRLPVLDPAQDWTYDSNRGVYAADAVDKTRTTKVPKNHVLSEATKEHPAQVTMYHEDVIAGTWRKIDFSGALPADDVAAIAARLDKLRTAVKFAREEANSIDVEDVNIGASFLGYLFEGGPPQVSG